SWKSSRDNLRWVFKLKEGATFHNGREVTAQDFVYTYTRILDPRTESGASALLMRIKGATDFIEGKTKTVEGL
ncbi:MAG: ABC transporter substrate-binding protein, partial [Candidatus Aenigmarchaeota archaeon]|nr:ABC transporter substrate-binding protein [Candidatus Aenigmarchaeota archaeon]